MARITSLDLARECGVSQGTVDRALNDRSGIGAATKARILERAKALGYTLNQSASNLAKGKTKTLGLVLFDLKNHFFAQIAQSVAVHARAAGYHVQLMLSGTDEGEERYCIDALAGRPVDGIILCSVQQGSEAAARMRRLGIPIVLVGNRIFPDGADRTRRDDAAFPFVGIDDFAAMGDAVARLLRLGYSRIVYVAPSLAHRGRANLDAQEQRLAGALAAAAAAALADRRPADNGAERGCADRGPAFTLVDRHPEPASMEALIPGPEPRTAVVCSSDLYALRLLSQFQARGFEFPRDLGLMGFDNLDFLSYLQPHLSTVDLPMEEVGREAVRVLLDGLSGKGSAPAVLAHRFILGQTLRDHGPA